MVFEVSKRYPITFRYNQRCRVGDLVGGGGRMGVYGGEGDQGWVVFWDGVGMRFESSTLALISCEVANKNDCLKTILYYKILILFYKSHTILRHKRNSYDFRLDRNMWCTG